jgi:hypothetical protein
MREDEYLKVVDETLNELIEAADTYIDEISEQLENYGNPEKLINKPFESWTAQDRMMLHQIYGKGNNPLTNLEFKKEFEALQEAEAEEV